MPSLTLWIAAVYGIIFLLSDAKILSEWIPIRPLLQRVKFFKSLMSCYFCMGIWVSAGLWVLLNWPKVFKPTGLLYVFAGAAGAYIIDLLTNFIETKMMTLFEGMVVEQAEEEDDG